MSQIHHRSFPSPIGELMLLATDEGLVEILFEGHEMQAEANGSADANNPDHPVLVQAAHELGEYFDGTRQDFTVGVVPSGTDFQLQCWSALDTIPYGTTVSYGEQADRLGKPSASRAVGAANGRNHLPIVRPCHRVVGANGSLTGFAGGIEAKRWLLDHEARVSGQRLV